MKKTSGIIAGILFLIFGLSSCGGGSEPGGTQKPGGDTPTGGGSSANGNIAVAYFSCTGTTESIADLIVEKTGGTSYRIQPAVPYTEDDLKYYTNCRADKEQADPTARPAMAGSFDNVDKYDTIFIGYPIWHGQAPKIIYTFLESCDFSGKTLVPFCTSGSSGIGSSATNLHSLAPNAEWKSGKRFGGGASLADVSEWVDSLGIKLGGEENGMRFFITVGDTRLEATLVDNAATKALKEKLKTAPVEVAMSDYGGFEKVGDFGFDLPTSDEQITAQPCDLMLYQGDRLVVFYGSNSWSYTRLGSIEGVAPEELESILGSGDVTVTLSLHSA